MNTEQTRSMQVQGMLYAVLSVLSLFLALKIFDQPFDTPYQILALMSGVFCFFMLRRYNLAMPWNVGRPGSIGTRLLSYWALMVAVMLFLVFLSKYSQAFSRPVIITWIFLVPGLILSLHGLVRLLLRHFLPHLAIRRSAVIVFASDTARSLAVNLRKSQNYEVLGYFEDRDLDRMGGPIDGLPLLGKARNVAQYVRDNGTQVVFVVLPDEGMKRAAHLFDELGDTTASVYYVPDFLLFNLLEAQMFEIEGIPVLQVTDTPMYGVDGIFKYLFDVIFSSIVLLLLAPLLLGIALAVKLDSPGPAVFKQKRYGLNGKRFWVYKFRSMKVGDPNAEMKQATRGDPRVTRLGGFLRRSSMDELLQFWNVIKGEMSVVGPRPHPVALNEHYRKEIKRYMVRHKVRPGITGWAQVHGLRGETAQVELMEQRIKYDLEYIKTWSPWLDIKIIIMTVFMVVRDKNAY